MRKIAVLIALVVVAIPLTLAACAFPDSYMLCDQGALRDRDECYAGCSTQADDCTSQCDWWSPNCYAYCSGLRYGCEWRCDQAYEAKHYDCECRYCGCL